MSQGIGRVIVNKGQYFFTTLLKDRLIVNSYKNFDLISIGEPLLRLSPPRYTQLRCTRSLDLSVAGSQLNVAADLARLGKKTSFVTKLPSNPLGFLVIDACNRYGVDVTFIKMVPGGKMGVTYVEFSAAPRIPLAVYDRTGSAASTINAGDFDWHGLADRTKFVYSDGIFPGLSQGCFEATINFFEAARKKGCTTCFDVNYRAHLWSPETARDAWIRILPDIDILVTNRNVSEVVFGYTGTDEAIMSRYAEDFGCTMVLFTQREMFGTQRGAWNSKLLMDGNVLVGKRFEFDSIDRYGTGDSWFSGFLYGYWEKGPQFALDFGNALCAVAHTIEGDVVTVSPDEVLGIMDNNDQRDVKR